jgi:hypothetical protein
MGDMDQDDPEIRPLPNPPRCRGVPIGDGHYTGCAFGYGDVPPFTPPCDCPICNGSGFEGPIETVFAHADFGDPDCCGCLRAVIHEREAAIVCNECGRVVRTVAVASLQRTLDDMELSLDVCTDICPHCRMVNVFPGLSNVAAYVCPQCGRSISIATREDR